MAEGATPSEGEPFVVHVELGKVREFARATGSLHPDHLDGERPVMPGTFLAVARLWQHPAATPWLADGRPMGRVLHGEQEFVFHGEPPRAGTRLTGRSRVSETYTKQGRRGGPMTFTVVVTEFHDEDGQLVAEAVGTSIETGRAPDGPVGT